MKKNSMKAIVVAVAAFGLMLTPLMTGCVANQTPQKEASAAIVSVQQSDAEDAEPEGRITVYIKVTEDVAGANLQNTALQFSEEEMSINAPEGSSALAFLEVMGRDVQTEETADGIEVTSIGGLGNGDAGEGSHWIYQVNGITQTVAPSKCVMHDNDHLAFIFVA